MVVYLSGLEQSRNNSSFKKALSAFYNETKG